VEWCEQPGSPRRGARRGRRGHRGVKRAPNVPPRSPIVESYTYEPELKVRHSGRKKPQRCRGAVPSGTVSPALFISREEFWIQTQLPLLLLLLANAVTCTQLTPTPSPYCPGLIMSSLSIPHVSSDLSTSSVGEPSAHRLYFECALKLTRVTKLRLNGC